MKNGSKLLGIFLFAALGLAIGATAANAENEWLIGSPLKTFTEAEISEKEFTGEIGKKYLLNEVVSITCPGGLESEITGVLKKGGTGNIKFLLKGCKVFGAETHCWIWEKLTLTIPNGKGKMEGSGTFNLFKHNGTHYLLLKGLGANSVISLFDIGGDALCPLATEEELFHYELKGSTVLRLLDPLTAATIHNVDSLTLTTLHNLFAGDKLKLGENEAHLSGKSSLEAESEVPATMRLTSGEVWGSN